MAARDELIELRRLAELEARLPKPVEGTPARASFLGRLGQGVGDRADTNVRKIGNLEHTLLRKGLGAIGIDIPELDDKSIFSDKSIMEQQQRTAPNSETGAGTLGNLASDLALTAPLGFVGKGMEGLAAARNTPRLARTLLAARPVQAATEGAIAGGALADPGQRKEGAATGAVIGTAFERGGAALGRTVRGLVNRSPEAKALENIADLHGTEVKLPLSQAASNEGVISPLVKFVYDKVLPNLPGAEGALAKQGQKAATQFREIAMKEGAPGGLGSTAPGYAGGLPMTAGKQAGAGSNVRASMDDIQKAFEREYADTVKSYVFNEPQAADLAAKLQSKFPNIDKATLNNVVKQFDSMSKRYANGGVLDGDNLIRMKNQLAKLGREAGDDRLGQSYYQAQEFLDDVVRSELRQGGKAQNLLDLQRYEDLAEPYKNFLRVQKAAGRAKSPTGEFSPQELKSAVKVMSNDRELAKGTAPMQELAELGEQTVGQKMHQPSFLERGLTMGALGGTGILSGPLGVAALVGGGRAAASPAVQDVLMGTNKAQQALTKALRNNPNKTRIAGAAVRNTAAAEAADDE